MERVWTLLSDPAAYERWIEPEAHLDRVEPPGSVQPGQVVVFSARAFGRWWRVTFDVQSVDVGRHRLHFKVALPLGIAEESVITCTPVDERTCYVQYG